MELYDENLEEKKSKIPTILGISIVVLIILTILIVAGIIYLKNSIRIIQIDGVRNNDIEKILYIQESEEGMEIYFPIVKTAQYLGYEGFLGDYKYKSEDNTKCHVKELNGNETAMFKNETDVLVKITSSSEIQYITLDKPVLEKDGELYTTKEGIEKAFNVLIDSDENFKNINIYSMDYLVTYYTTRLKIEKYSTKFADKKAIFEDMIIIQEDDQYGVRYATTGKAVLETKYEEIRYLPTTTDFIVKFNGKYGIVTKDKVEKARAVYDEIKTMDNENGLYLIKQNNAYGVMNTNGEIIIQPEYKQIGVNNISQYAQNGVENAYVLLNEIIPIMDSQNLWGFFNIKGEKITEFKYTGLGCTSSTVTNSYPILVVPSSKIIVVAKDKYYSLVTSSGEQLIPDNILNSVYLKLNAETGENQFFMTYNKNEKVINIEEWLAKIEG